MRAVADQRNHFRTVFLLWVALSVVGVLVTVFVIGPGLPPGEASDQAHGQVIDNTVLLAVSAPLIAAVLAGGGYSLWMFRERRADVIRDGPAIRGDSSVQYWWIAKTSLVVVVLASYGSIRLLQDGAGGGQGPTPLSTPAAFKNHPLQVQVVAQQWQFTYRYPGYGGVETAQLELPADSPVEFHVTSLDVIHSFWAYELGVKADANPGEDNVAYVQTRGPVTFHVRCAELCGVWHGYMFNTGRVVPKTRFTTWIADQQRQYRPATSKLPGYSRSYFPQPLRRGG
jgi:cytochrome c oxidase subunit 2